MQNLSKYLLEGIKEIDPKIHGYLSNIENVDSVILKEFNAITSGREKTISFFKKSLEKIKNYFNRIFKEFGIGVKKYYFRTSPKSNESITSWLKDTIIGISKLTMDLAKYAVKKIYEVSSGGFESTRNIRLSLLGLFISTLMHPFAAAGLAFATAVIFTSAFGAVGLVGGVVAGKALNAALNSLSKVWKQWQKSTDNLKRMPEESEDSNATVGFITIMTFVLGGLIAAMSTLFISVGGAAIATAGALTIIAIVAYVVQKQLDNVEVLEKLIEYGKDNVDREIKKAALYSDIYNEYSSLWLDRMEIKNRESILATKRNVMSLEKKLKSIKASKEYNDLSSEGSF